MIVRVFLLIMIWIGAVAADARPELSVPAELEISQREVLYLSDIVMVTGGNAELLNQLDKIVIRKDARELLLSQELPSSEVLQVIRAELQANPDFKKMNPAIKVASKVKVSFSKAPISKAEIERRVLNQLSAQCSDCEFKVNVQSTPFPLSHQWKVDYSQLAQKGSFLVPLTDGEARPQKWISGNIRMLKLTPVATRMIQQGERLQSTDIKMEMTDVTFAKDAGVNTQNLEGQLAARAITVGSPIWQSDLKREPAAVRGQILKAILGDEEYEITTTVQAEENGFVGDVIKTKNMDTKKILSGVIVEKGVVKLQ